MKNIFIYCILAVSLIGCTSFVERLDESLEPQEEVRLMVNAGYGRQDDNDPQTKMTLDVIDDVPYAKWEFGDTLGIMSESLKNTQGLPITNLSENEISNFGSFEYVGPEAESYYTFYPYIKSDSFIVPFPSLAEQNLKSNDWKSLDGYLSYIGKEPAKAVDNELHFVLEGVSSIMELKVKSTDGTAQIKSVQMKNSNINARIIYNLKSKEITNKSYYTGTINANYSDTPTITTDGYTVFRFAFYPFTVSGDINFKFTFTDGRTLITTVSKPDYEFQAGKRYIKELNIDCTDCIYNWDGVSIEQPTSIDENGFMKIENAAQLAWLSYNHSSYEKYILSANIDLSGYSWRPIGRFQNTFKGTFNGNGKSIYNLNLKGSSSDEYFGFFGEVENAEIYGLTLESGYIDVVTPYAGGICASAKGATIRNCVNKCNMNVQVDRGAVGGICGVQSQGSLVRECHNYGNITVKAYNYESLASVSAGGISGNGNVSNSTNAGSVVINPSGSIHDLIAGGICGAGNVTDCVNSGQSVKIEVLYSSPILSSNFIVKIGGIVGSSVTVNNCTNHASVTASGYDVAIGGIVGDADYVNDCINEGYVGGGKYTKRTGVGDVSIGGILGAGGIGQVKGCVNRNYVYGHAYDRGSTVYLGGIIGQGIKVVNCSNIGDVEAGCSANSEAYYGGIAGWNLGGDIGNSYSASDDRSSSSIRGYGGGLTGYGSGYNSYWLLEEDGTGFTQAVGKGGSVSETSKTKAEMQSAEFVELMNSNAFNGYKWKEDTEGVNGGFPVLYK